MKVIIVEDEIAASDNLTYMLNSIDPKIEIISVIDSVSDAIKYFKTPISEINCIKFVVSFLDLYVILKGCI